MDATQCASRRTSMTRDGRLDDDDKKDGEDLCIIIIGKRRAAAPLTLTREFWWVELLRVDANAFEEQSEREGSDHHHVFENARIGG